MYLPTNGGKLCVTILRLHPLKSNRNFGIMWAFLIALCATYLLAAEFITAKKSKGEVLLFRRAHTPASLKQKSNDEEAIGTSVAGAEKTNNADLSAIIKKQTAIFHWEDLCYDIKIKGEPRRILDHVDGWVKPGTLTALMVCFIVLTKSYP